MTGWLIKTVYRDPKGLLILICRVANPDKTEAIRLASEHVENATLVCAEALQQVSNATLAGYKADEVRIAQIDIP